MCSRLRHYHLGIILLLIVASLDVSISAVDCLERCVTRRTRFHFYLLNGAFLT